MKVYGRHRSRSATLTAVCAAVIAALAAGPAARAEAVGADADTDLLCTAPEEALQPARWLRALSLDVRGQLPSPEETQAVLDAEATGEDGAADLAVGRLLDEWLVSDAFAERFVRLHRELLWNNIADQRPFGVAAGLSLGNNTTTSAYRSGTVATRLRGMDVRCLNEPATFDADGVVVTTLQPDGTRREGYVEVAPYWAPDTTIRVCAFDAQTRAVSMNGIPCNSNSGTAERDCGCGPNLNWCGTNAQAVTLMQSFASDVDRRMRDIVREDRPYLDLFTGSRAYVNGPIVHFLRHQTNITRMRVLPLFVDLARLPDLTFSQVDTWVEVDLGQHHAGVLTSPAFLLRFQTERARANRFYTAFLCQPFDPPAGGLPVADEASVREPDLQLRAGCSYCHAVLEPASAHWGRWGERGMSYLDPEDFPAYDAACAGCARSNVTCPTRCSQNYVTRPLSDKEAAWTGWLLGYTFRRPEHMLAVERGPELLVHTAAVDGRLPRCMAKTALSHLLGDAEDVHDEAWIDGLAQGFVASDFRFRDILRSILLDATYRRVR
jgi:hypothetical protein